MSKQIALTKGKFALVDDEDFERVNGLPWVALEGTHSWYAVRTITLESGKRTNLSMPRFILGIPKGGDVDHRDGNGLNNTRANLRPCTRSQNQFNKVKMSNGRTSRFKGVNFERRLGKFKVQITINKKQTYLGLFVDEIEAAKIYDEAAKIHHGEFALLNFPTEAHHVSRV